MPTPAARPRTIEMTMVRRDMVDVIYGGKQGLLSAMRPAHRGTTADQAFVTSRSLSAEAAGTIFPLTHRRAYPSRSPAICRLRETTRRALSAGLYRSDIL